MWWLLVTDSHLLIKLFIFWAIIWIFSIDYNQIHECTSALSSSTLVCIFGALLLLPKWQLLSSSHKWSFTLEPRKYCSPEQYFIWVPLSKNSGQCYLSLRKWIKCEDSYYYKSHVKRSYWFTVNRNKLMLIAPGNQFHHL